MATATVPGVTLPFEKIAMRRDRKVELAELNRFLLRHNLSQAALAALLHVSASTVYRWVVEEREIPFAVIELLRIWDRESDSPAVPVTPKPRRKK